MARPPQMPHGGALGQGLGTAAMDPALDGLVQQFESIVGRGEIVPFGEIEGWVNAAAPFLDQLPPQMQQAWSQFRDILPADRQPRAYEGFQPMTPRPQ